MTRDSALEMSLIEEVARLSSSGSSSKPSWKCSASAATRAKGAALPEFSVEVRFVVGDEAVKLMALEGCEKKVITGFR